MPIEGMTTRPVEDARMTEIGQLRKGAPKPHSGPGKDLECFRFTTTDPKAEADFAAAYPEDPNDIEVFLPWPTWEQNFFAFREKWAASRLEHRCDGVQIWAYRSGVLAPTGQPCPTINLPDGDGRKCKQVGRLSLILPCLRRFALVTALTTSINDIVNISEELKAIEAMARDLRGIPLILSRRPKSISTPRGGQERQRAVKWLIHVEINPEWAERKLMAQRHAAELAWNDSSLRLLPGPDMRVVNTQTGEQIYNDPQLDDPGDDDDAPQDLEINNNAQDVPHDEIWIDDPDSPAGEHATFDPIDADPRVEAQSAKAERHSRAISPPAQEAAAAPLGTFEERTMAANADLLGIEGEAPQRAAGLPKRTTPANAAAQAQTHRQQNGESRAIRAQAEIDAAPSAYPDPITPKMITDAWRAIDVRWKNNKIMDPENPTKIRQISTKHWGLDLAKATPTRLRKLWDQINLYNNEITEYEAVFNRQEELPL